ncbi:MAG: NAD(P)H-dependent oxidoreductase [Pseudomonadota bacterium]
MPHLLIIAHYPSPNLERLATAVLNGARAPEIDKVDAELRSPFETTADDVFATDGLILGTPENLGYMSGALKDFFDRTYMTCIEQTDAKPFTFFIRAGHDGTGTRRAIESITTGLKWKSVQAPLICRGEWQDDWLEDAHTLGMTMAAGLEAGIF